MKIKWLTSFRHLIQAYNSGLEYAFISKDMKQCHPFVLCKDFLHDIVHANLNKKPVSIFGLVYKTTGWFANPSIDLECTRIALVNSSRNLNIIDVVDFVNQFCQLLRRSRT